MLQQFAGINGVLYFSSLTFRDVGITSSALASLFVGITNLAGTIYGLHLYIFKQFKKSHSLACTYFQVHSVHHT